MHWSDLPLKPSARVLRQFAALWLAAFSAAAIWQGVVRGHGILAAALAALGLTFGVLGMLRPAAIRPVFVGWMILIFPVNWLVSRLLLALIYYALFTPTGVLLKLLGRDVLQRRRQQGRATYWLRRRQPDDVRRYFSQF
jgi:hypothetical protein